jgi:lipopolysaccharide transport system ATP-binding protein
VSSLDPTAAIEVRGIGKRYNVGTGRQGSSIVDRVGGLVGGGERNPFSDSYLWALKDVSFDVPSGKVVGLLGRNGSGKTTLVQILSRVTSPTEGTAVVNGRVGALFQAGAGFHPELTGRENIALSGAVLGMSEAQTNAAFDDIVDFAGIGDFLDAPVKHYSSGMYQRLAFSVSAHLDAEIMLIDEALAVGDAAFQEKCRVHIRGMVLTGRTVVYVSHNLDSVRQLSDSAIVLEAGELVYDGDVEEAIEKYLELSKRKAGKAPQQPLPRPRN